MNPFRIFRFLRDFVVRHPIIAGFAAVWFLGEAANVLDAIDVGKPVWIFGHLSSEIWQASEEERWLAIYAGALGICGIVLLGLAIFGKRTPQQGGAAAPPAPARAATPKPTTPPRVAKAPGSDGGAIVWRRKVKEVRPNRLGR